MLTRTYSADLLRDQILCTLPGDSYKYIVQAGDTLFSIVQTYLHTQDIQQTSYYVSQIVSDPRNFLISQNQELFPGQTLYIPKRIV